MIDRIFFAALTFCLLIAGTLAIGAAMFGLDQRSTAARAASAIAPTRVVQLERVVVTGKRLAPGTPTTAVAQAGAGDAAAQRLQ